MYNKQLDTFLKAAELGSFSRAAEALYITPSAVIQQVNALEGDLGVALFSRTRRGVSLTAAGELLQREGEKLVAQDRDLRRRLQELWENPRREVCVGTTLLYQCRHIYKWWTQFTMEHKNVSIRIKNLQDTEDPKELEDVDFIEGVYYKNEFRKTMDFLEVEKVPVGHALWKEHPLAKKRILRYEDMVGQTLVTLSGASHVQLVGFLREKAREHGITILPVERYDLSVLSMCIAQGYLLQLPLSGEDICSELVTIPCDWDYTLPRGLFYKKDPTPAAAEFLSFVKERLREETLSLL